MSWYGDPVTTPYQLPPPPPRLRRPRRRGASLWVALLLLAVLIVVADRAAAALVNQRLQEQIVAGLAAHGVEYDSAEVDVGGFPFLVQLAMGRYEVITIELGNVRSAQVRDVVLPHLTVVATGVSADTADLIDGGSATVLADQVTGMALVSFPTVRMLVADLLADVADTTFFDDSGVLHVTGNVTVSGVSVPITAAVVFSVSKGQLNVSLRELTVVGVEVPSFVAVYVNDLMQRTVQARLPTLPFGLTLEEVHTQPDGLAITAIARAVSLVA